MLLNYYLAGMRKIEPTMWFRGTAISQHFSTLLSYFEHNDRIFPSSSAISQHSSTCQNTRVYNIVDFKNILFQSSTRIHQTRLIQKIPLWRAVSKLCSFDVRIHWFHVNGRPIRKKKLCDLKSVRIRVDLLIKSLNATTKTCSQPT